MKIFLQYGSQSNLYFLSWYGFTVKNNPEKIKEYPLDLDDDKLKANHKKIAQIKLTNDIDLYPIIVELSAHMQIEHFINGFYCFNHPSKNITRYIKEDPRKELVDKLKLIIHKLKVLINKKVEGYSIETIDMSQEYYENAVRNKNFNLINVFNVIVEEKKVLSFCYRILNFRSFKTI